MDHFTRCHSVEAALRLDRIGVIGGTRAMAARMIGGTWPRQRPLLAKLFNFADIAFARRNGAQFESTPEGWPSGLRHRS
jgi:hypothetical protein